jgi:hypothetical protein
MLSQTPPKCGPDGGKKFHLMLSSAACVVTFSELSYLTIPLLIKLAGWRSAHGALLLFSGPLRVRIN